MANRSKATGENASTSNSTPSRRPRQATSFAPRALTQSEIEWLKREGKEFQEQYSQIKAAVRAEHDADRSVDLGGTPASGVVNTLAMQPEFIIDTSAIRCLQASFLEAASKRYRLTVSPLSVFEILCHLDKPSERHGSADAAFAFRKSHVLKCRHLQLRDDPFAEQAASVGASAVVNPTRFEDKVVVPQIYSLLEPAKSLDEFYEKYVTYPTGERGQLREVADRAWNVLKESEDKFIEHVKSEHNRLVNQFGFDAAMRLEGTQYVQYIVAVARDIEHYYHEHGIVPAGGGVFSAIFFHAGYVLARTQLYMRRAGEGAPLNIDRNDMEDAAILLHLDLTKPRVLITNDGAGKREGTIHAFKKALDHLERAAAEMNAPVVALPRVMTPDEFSTMLTTGSAAATS